MKRVRDMLIYAGKIDGQLITNFSNLRSFQHMCAKGPQWFSSSSLISYVYGIHIWQFFSIYFGYLVH